MIYLKINYEGFHLRIEKKLTDRFRIFRGAFCIGSEGNKSIIPLMAILMSLTNNICMSIYRFLMIGTRSILKSL